MRLTRNENISSVKKISKDMLFFACMFILNYSFPGQAECCKTECLRVKLGIYTHKNDFILFYFEVEIKTMN